MATLPPLLGKALTWGFTSREDTNYTYDLTEYSYAQMAHMIAVVSGKSPIEIRGYIEEVRRDAELRTHVLASVTNNSQSARSDMRYALGRRAGWYALVRAKRPKIVVETGVDKGLGSVVLCAALIKNASEGYPGRYFGTDITPHAGWMLAARYAGVGRILYGDSIASLKHLDEKVDLFINDSDHSADYEEREFSEVASKLAEGSVIIGDNSFETDKLLRFAEKSGRKFLLFRETPADHWFPGAGMGVAY